jgi:GTP-binding protein
VSNLIAIVGRPNVGKSALFNRIVKKRIAIVHDQPGVTRDRVSVEAEWNGKSFTLVDTGGIGLLRREKSEDIIVKAALEQVNIAIDAASAIILVVNVQEGVVPLDREVAQNCGPAASPFWSRSTRWTRASRKKTWTNFPGLVSRKCSPSARSTAKAFKI